MGLLLRRVRGMVSTGLVWGGGWALFAALAGTAVGLFRLPSLPPYV